MRNNCLVTGEPHDIRWNQTDRCQCPSCQLMMWNLYFNWYHLLMLPKPTRPPLPKIKVARTAPNKRK